MPTRISRPTLESLASAAVVAAALCGNAFAQQPAPAKAPAPAANPFAVPDESQPGLSKGEVKAIREFKMLDFNGDGKLSRSEVKLFPRLAAAFDDADTDHDGFASYAEVRAFAAKYRAERDRKKAEQAAAAQPATPAEPAPSAPASSAPQ
ncbi:EF-hand domain-containing protein [Acidovorax sp. sic0104]|uniref:EF-hand domain-containing protein n=1 Tax=Acidovorax sp. sic0104 TaxID=2854784 RepID=UPI0021053C0B|nr:EF-hand domain-containing protein [Acidovorax sp. sic0104]